MNNFKEYPEVKKDSYWWEIGVVIICLLVLIIKIQSGDFVGSLVTLAILVACVGYIIFMKKLRRSVKVFVQIDNGFLKYFENDNLVGTWNIKETDIGYSAYKDRFSLSINDFNLVIIHDEDNVEILTCTYLDYLELYNDIMEIQGKEKVESFRSF